MPFANALAKLEFDRVLRRIVRYTRSEPGARFLKNIQVQTSPEIITKELSTVSEMKSLLESESEIPIDGIFPIAAILQKSSVDGALLSGTEILHVGSTLNASRLIRSFLQKHKEQSPLVWEIAETIEVDKVLEFNIEKTVDESGEVKVTASKELQTIRRSIAEKYESLRKKLGDILRRVSDAGFSQEEIITTREGRMVLPVKVEHKNQVSGFIHSASASGATVFIEPTETLDLNNEIRSLQFQEQREITRLLKEITVQIGEARQWLQVNLEILAHLDALQAKGKHSIEVVGRAATVTADGQLVFKGARHPLLLQAHGYAGTVPLDLTLGDEYSTLVISGPNAGGKSVAMKCVGLLVLMIQSGLHIPASEASVRAFRKVFVDIGDDQSVENDLSTFSSHLKNLKEISRNADEHSLVLIDEIGSGTDPAEGSSIAASFLELLTKRRTLTIATTHHGMLKLFAHETEGIENGAMEFDHSTLAPTYRFRSGIPGSSFALEMAERLGLSPELLGRARALLGPGRVKLDELLTKLESSVQQYEEKLREARENESGLRTLKSEYESKLKNQSKELRELKRAAVSEAKVLVDKANALIEQAIKEIREQEASRDSIKTSGAILDSLRKEIDREEETVRAVPVAEGNGALLHEGSLVVLDEGSEMGEIISIDKETATVVFGALKIRVPLSQLVPAKGDKRARSRVNVSSIEKPDDVQQELDLRGMTGAEALSQVDKFIDSAILSGLNRVDIIHGKGTGALRKKVGDFLSSHPRVRSFRLGDWNEGGMGVTIVDLAD
ncbi:MAG TPA: endonuclease MutS2 [Bacteroidota bacterium]